MPEASQTVGCRWIGAASVSLPRDTVIGLGAVWRLGWSPRA